MKTQIKEKLFQSFMWIGFIGIIVLGIVLAASLSSCKAQESVHNTIESDTILFNFSCVDDVIWSEDDGMYYIEYNDPDAFDYDNLAYLTGRNSWYGEYIIVDIDESILPIFLNDQELYNKETDYCKKDDLNMLYTIVEHKITFPDSTIDYIWEIKLRGDIKEIIKRLKDNMKLKVIHTGQYRAYGDTHREYEIHMTNEEICTTSIDEILKLCNNGSKLPKDEWQARKGNIDDYFKGYYTLTSTDFGYMYHGVEPYTD